MCAIIGAVFKYLHSDADIDRANEHLNYMLQRSLERGRDGFGYTIITASGVQTTKNVNRQTGNWDPVRFFSEPVGAATFICNMRAEPTTEYVKDKQQYDQQPYTDNGWHVVHNGTIPNDLELRALAKQKQALLDESWQPLKTKIDSAAIVETLATDNDYLATIAELKGSYAMLVSNQDDHEALLFACNYRPIWVQQVDEFAVFLASSENYFKMDYCTINQRPTRLEPYSAGTVWFSPQDNRFHLHTIPLRTARNMKALVVCSGGLDSVVAATMAKKELGYDITLLHFQYGSRAEGPEINAIHKVAEALGAPLWIRTIDAYDPSDSPLLQKDSKIAGGEEGAEFAYEWVPARNLLMLAHATALAEAKGFDTIVLGNNLEEAGAYPDNEPEFINQFNKVLDYAIGDGKHIRIAMPVGNMMKHEIVKAGIELNAPLEHTWSCYKAGDKHCGKCGPCFMRKTAFSINNQPEVIEYED